MHRLSALIILFVTHSACAQSAPDVAQPAKRETTKANVQAATVTFAITPWGEVLVDGEARGLSPPLKSTKLAPGEHAIIIKNPDFKPYADTIVVQPGEAITVRHTFSK